MSVNLRMSFLDQMKLPALIDLSLVLILASVTKGQEWDINVPTPIKTTVGADVTILCTFTHPEKFQPQQVYWKKEGKKNSSLIDKDQNPNIYHEDPKLVLEKYKGKTKFIGDKDKKNCSLIIYDIQDSELKIYVRVIANGDQFSFKEKFVSIYLDGATPATPGTSDIIISSPSPTFETSTTTENNWNSTSTYTAISVSVAVLVIIILVAGIVFCIKHKRSKSLTREDSGYYANFSRASSNQAKRETFSKKQDNKIPPEMKAIDDPVYINMEAPPEQMDQHMDHTDNIYANVDYSK